MNKSSINECYEYWKNEVNELKDVSNPDKNHPLIYACKPKTIIDLLHNFWSQYVTKTDIILEIGCNSGVNLNYLQTVGYSNLVGIDINKNAIYIMSQLFPETFKKTDLYIGSLGEILPTFQDKSVDVTFSMAVLEHIHPDIEEEVFKNIIRITKKYIVTNEYEDVRDTNRRTFARNYKDIFEKFGCKQKKVIEKCNILPEYGYFFISDNNGKKQIAKNLFRYDEHITRLFEVNK